MGGNFRPIACKKALRALINLGFEEDLAKQKGSHRRFRKTKNNITFNVTLDCHSGEVSARNVKSMAAQAGVSLSEFLSASEDKLITSSSVPTQS